MLDADVVTLVTGFGSVWVRYGAITTRGLWEDDEAVDSRTGALVRARTLVLVASAVAGLTAEADLEVGALEDDASRTTYRVVDARRDLDGLTLRVWVAT